MNSTHTTPNHADRVYLTDADPPMRPGDGLIWIALFTISAGVFGLECWGIYSLLHHLFN